MYIDIIQDLMGHCLRSPGTVIDFTQCFDLRHFQVQGWWVMDRDHRPKGSLYHELNSNLMSPYLTQDILGGGGIVTWNVCDLKRSYSYIYGLPFPHKSNKKTLAGSRGQPYTCKACTLTVKIPGPQGILHTFLVLFGRVMFESSQLLLLSLLSDYSWRFGGNHIRCQEIKVALETCKIVSFHPF